MKFIFFGVIVFLAGWGWMDILNHLKVPTTLRYIFLAIVSIIVALGITEYVR